MISLNENDAKKLAKVGAVTYISRQEYGIGFFDGASEDFVNVYCAILSKCECKINFFTDEELKEAAREGATAYLKSLDYSMYYKKEVVKDFMNIHQAILSRLFSIYENIIIYTDTANENNFGNEQSGKQK